MKQNESVGTMQKKVCQECGQYMTEQVESCLNECERCLAKKEE